MSALYLLIPLSLILIALALVAFIWSVNSGQYDDLDSPAWQILDEEDKQDDDSST